MFVDAAVAWQRTGNETFLLAMLRGKDSGVPHDIGAAYATLGARTGSVLEAMEAGRLALPPPERDLVLRFVQRARKVRNLPMTFTEDEVAAAACEVFGVVMPRFDFAQRDGTLRPSTAALRASAQGDDDKEIELAEPAVREEAAGVAGWQRHFSASALNAYAECARKWFYRYACSAIEDPGSSASAYGTAFHLALEDFHEEFPRPRADDEAAMRRRIREHVTWAFERNRDGFATRVEFELHVRRAQRTAQRYVEWLLAQEREAPFEVLGREVAAEIDLDGFAFVGYIDRLDRDERSGAVGVVDYKTGSIATSVAEYADKVRRFGDFQLPFYYWARRAAGDDVAKLVLIPLKDALLDVRPIVLEVGKTIALADLERSRKRMVELSALLASGETRRFEPAKNPAACTYCAYAVACAQKPPPQAQKFGS